MTDETKPQESARPASPADELVKDLPVKVSEAEAGMVTGGRELKGDGSLGGSVKLGYDFGTQIKA